MARGQVFTLPNQTSRLIESVSAEEIDSVAVLNPNDGVVYLKLNGPAGPTASQWDWKLPSQSYGLFPGPWVSLGLFYLDQSGSGRSAELNVYDSRDKMYTPYIVAIGRAVQSAGTTMDISQGAQPANPPASTVRLWADGEGDLHIVSSTGVDNEVLDTSNYDSTISVIGDVIGPLSNTRIQLRHNTFAYGKDSGGSNRNLFWIASDNVHCIGSFQGGIAFVNYQNTQRVATIDNAGNLAAVAGTFTGRLVAQGSNTSGIGSSGTSLGGFEVQSPGGGAAMISYHRPGAFAAYMGLDTDNIWKVGGWSMGGSAYRILLGDNFSNAGAGVTFPQVNASYINSNGNIDCGGGTYYFVHNAGINLTWDGTHIAFTHGITLAYGATIYFGDTNRYIANDNNAFYFYGYPGLFRYYRTNWGGYTDVQIDTAGNFIVSSPWGGYVLSRRFVINGYTCGLDLGRQGNEASTYTHTYNAGSHYVTLDSSATSYTTRSSLKYKTNVNEFSEEECLARILSPKVKMYTYEHIIPDAFQEAHNNRPPDSTNPNPSRIGFLAEEMIEIVPEACATNTTDGTPEGIAYAELVTLVWGAVRNIDERLRKVESST